MLAANVFFTLFSILGAGAAVATAYLSYLPDLPSAEEVSQQTMAAAQSTRLYDRTGQHVLYEIIPTDGGLRTWAPLDRIPEHLRNATIAMEDKTFYTNPAGINIEGLARAVWGELRGQYAGGGSSIPQQLIRNVIMTPEERMERSYSRKLKELVLSTELSRLYPGVEGRDTILEWYLNTIFYGHLSYGVEAASQTYFGKSVEDLSLAEVAMLVPLGQSPALNPKDAPQEAKRRQEIVLDGMAEQGYITPEQAWEAKQEQLVIASPQAGITAPHFVFYVRDLLIYQYGAKAVYGGGLQVITSLDLEIEEYAQQAVREHLREIAEKYDAHNGAVVVLDAKTAEIRAMVGSRNYDDASIDGRVNMALAPRQPGSSVKPYVYATAFAQGYTPATMVMDVRTSFTDAYNLAPYVPENYSRNYHGPMLLRRALACSYNIPAVAVTQKVGPMKVVETAHTMGINTLNRSAYGLAVGLGSGEVSLLDHAYGFSVFANGGVMLGQPVPEERWKAGYRRLDPVAIIKVTDAQGKLLYDYKEPQRQQVIRPDVSYLVTDILSDNRARTPAFGADNPLTLPDRPVAAKTGTTNDFRDGWAMGYTPQYVVGVWVGNANYQEMKGGADGVRVAAPIWQKVMAYLHDGVPVETFAQPPGIVTAIVDGTSGKLPTEHSASRIQEIFIEGTVPTEKDDVHQAFRIDRTSGKLATAYCPPEEVEVRVFDIYPPEAADWVREQNIPQPPREYCDIHGPNLSHADVAITEPKQFGIVRGIVPIMGNARAGAQERHWLEYSEGYGGSSWQRIGPDHGERVDNGVLEIWDTTGLDGLYTLRLGVVDGGALRQFSVQALVDNRPPRVSIVNPDPYAPDEDPTNSEFDRTYEVGKDEWINIQVIAVDNTAMARVDFYLNGRFLGFSTVAPFTLRWNLKMDDLRPNVDFGLAEPRIVVDGERTIREEVLQEGPDRVFVRTVQEGDKSTVTRIVQVPLSEEPDTHIIHVVAFDAVGNESRSEPVQVRIVSAPPK
jgi:membrane carboxypeptidase/penicillin-binding protein